MGDGMGQTILCTKCCRCQKTKSIDLLQDKSPLYENRSFYVFEPLLGVLEAMYTVPFRLIGKPVVDFLLTVIELLSLEQLWLTIELRPNIDWKSPF